MQQPTPAIAFVLYCPPGSETPSRTSWGHFFVKDSAKHPLIVEAEAQIEALFNSAAVRGGYGPLAKVEAIQGERELKLRNFQWHCEETVMMGVGS